MEAIHYLKAYGKAALIAIIITSLIGCASSEGSKPIPVANKLAGAITIWSFSTDGEEKINKAFNQLYPDIKIEVIPVPWADYDNKFRIALASGGELPDIVTVESYWWGKWLAMKGTFDDLSQYGVDANAISSMASNVIKGKDGEFHMVPVSMGIGCLWYRKDLAQKYYNVSDAESLEAKLKSWDDLLQLGEKIHAESGGKDFLFADTMSLEEFLLASDNDYIQGNVLQLNQKVLPHFRMIETMLKKGYIAKYKGMELDNSYTKGNVFFYPYADWHGEYIKGLDTNGAGKWGMMLPPDGAFFRGGYGYAIPKKSNPANKQAAVERIKFMLTEQGAQAVLETNQFSAYKNAFSDQALNKVDPYFGENIFKKLSGWSQQMTNKSIHYGEYDDVINKELRIQAYNMMVSGISADEAMKNTVQELTSKLQNNIQIK